MARKIHQKPVRLPTGWDKERRFDTNEEELGVLLFSNVRDCCPSGGGKSLELCAVFPTKDFNQQSWDTFETSKFSGEVSSVDTVSTRYQPVKNNSKGKKVLNF